MASESNALTLRLTSRSSNVVTPVSYSVEYHHRGLQIVKQLSDRAGSGEPQSQPQHEDNHIPDGIIVHSVHTKLLGTSACIVPMMGWVGSSSLGGPGLECSPDRVTSCATPPPGPASPTASSSGYSP